MNAATRGHTDVVHLLLERVAASGDQDLDGFRAITLVAAEGHWEIVRLLIDDGADSRRADGYGQFPLSYARVKRPPELVHGLDEKAK